MGYQFLILDVFTEKRFGGNQLAVFPKADGVSDAVMQQVAREFNFAETTFVVTPSNPQAEHRIRIFTPKRELPFAGHPTVGTAAALAHLGMLEGGKGGVHTFEEGICALKVEVGAPDGVRTFAELQVQTELVQPSEKPDARALARSLGLAHGDVIDTWFAAVGVPFCFIHLRGKDVVDRAVLDRHVWLEEIAPTWAPQLFMFAGDYASGGKVYARMFAPAFGIDEDPATGSASVALVAHLSARYPGASPCALEIEQGVAMGRPSRMLAAATKTDAGEQVLHVGGNSVVVAQGSMDL